MTEPVPTVRPTRYEVSVLPEADVNYRVYVVAVEHRGNGRWAVVRHGECLDAAGAWSWESIPSERTEEWLADHRFSLDDAIRHAEAAAPRVIVNGRSALEALSHRPA